MPKTWQIGLEASPWQRTKEGKAVEYRLNDPKWADMAVGDIIEYLLEPKRVQIVRVEVVELIRCPTFGELLGYCDQHGYIEQHRTRDEQVQRLERRYPEERRKQYNGVLGIRQRLLPE